MIESNSPLTDADMLDHLMDARGISQKQLATDTGIRESKVSAVMTVKRKLTRAHIAILAKYFHVSPAAFF